MTIIPLDAPGFRGRDPKVLEQFIRHLSDASYHRAGEGRNYDATSARVSVDAAAELAIAHRFNYWTIDALFRNADPLVERAEIIDRIFRKVYENA